MVGRHSRATVSRLAPAQGQPLIPSWVRVAVILTIIPVWAVVVLYSLAVLKELPGAEWTIVPSAIITAVAPAWRIRRSPASGSDPEDEGSPDADTEERSA